MILDIMPTTADVQSVGIILLLIDRLITWLSKSKPDTLIKIYTEYKLKKNTLISDLDKETLQSLKLETKALKESNSYLLKEIEKYDKASKTLDILRDKFNFKRVFTVMLSNGTVTLSGSGLFYYSIGEECYSYKETSIKHLYQRKLLTPLYPLISELLHNPIWDSESNTDIDEINRLMSLHKSSRIIAVPLNMKDDIIGILFLVFGDYTTYPNTSDLLEDISLKDAESDVLLTKHVIESIYTKYV